MTFTCGKDSPTTPAPPAPTTPTPTPPTTPTPPEPQPDPPKPTKITIAPATLTPLTAAGQTVRLTASVRDQHDNTMTDADVAWMSSNTEVATVSAAGLVTATGDGTATITATAGGATATVQVTVSIPSVPASIVIAPAEPEPMSAAGQTVQLTATVKDQHDNTMTDADVTWMSSDTEVATVSDTGQVTAIGDGTATITATAGGVTATAQVTVSIRPSADRAALVALYESTDGANWTDRTNWLSDRPLDAWYGVTANASGDVERLRLGVNGLNGALPGELGDLAGLKGLYLSENDLSGPIPASLGNLTQLEHLVLSNNDLSGPIPPSLGNLIRLEHLEISNNDLTGAIPASFGNLTRLGFLLLFKNGLSGAIPPELGNLTGLEELHLFENPDLSGPLPMGFRNMDNLQSLQLHRTGLCLPADPGFAAWFRAVPDRSNLPACAPTTGSFAYLTQATQSFGYPVPLLAGETALLRVFITSDRDAGVALPPARATFYRDGAPAHVAELPGKATPVPKMIDEGSLSASLNDTIPGAVIAPGLEMVVEIDPDGTLPADAGIARRVPAAGRMPVDVLTVPPLNLTLVPLIRPDDPDSAAALAQLEGITAADDRFWPTRDLLPVGELNVTVREYYKTTNNPWNDRGLELMWEMNMLRTTDGAAGHYMGVLRGGGGTAMSPGFASVSDLQPLVIAHELGHNMSLEHAPCGGPIAVDPDYPNDDATIGAWGYDFRDGTLKHPLEYRDIMSYCGPSWIGPYNFIKALRYRHFHEAGQATGGAPETNVLLLWGGIDAYGALVMEPGFALHAAPALPRRNGPYRLTGKSTDGRTLFSMRFAMERVAEDEGGAFAFTLPVRPRWAAALGSVVLSGPEGVVTIERDGPRTSALLLDRFDGKVRGYLRDWPDEPASVSARRTSSPAEFDVTISSGLPDPSAWMRR